MFCLVEINERPKRGEEESLTVSYLYFLVETIFFFSLRRERERESRDFHQIDILLKTLLVLCESIF